MRDGGKVVIGQHHSAALTRGIGAFASHGHADVGLLERWGVVHTIACHGHHLAAGLQGPNQAQLVLGAGASKNSGLAQQHLQVGIVQAIEIRPGDDCSIVVGRVRAQQAQGLGDGARGHGMVARDHHHADTGRLAACHGCAGLVARRIDDAHDAEQGQSLIDVGVLQVAALMGPSKLGQGQHATPGAGLSLHRRLPPL